MTAALDRILAEAGRPDLLALLAERLEPTDLQTLLLAVAARRAARRSPADVLADYERNRFFGAAEVTPPDYAAWDAAAASRLSGRFEALALAPMTPLGTSSVVASVDQDWSVPTMRTGEVVSDPTNVLALEAALRRRALLRADPRDPALVHLATTHRVVRPQRAADPKLRAHFVMFALVSAGRDRGGHATEAAAVAAHLDVLLGSFRALAAPATRLVVSYTIRTESRDDARLAALRDAAARHGAEVEEEPDRAAARGYYAGFCFHVWAEPPGGERLQLADGGVTDWVARLLSNSKERTLISGCGVERPLSLRRF